MPPWLRGCYTTSYIIIDLLSIHSDDGCVLTMTDARHSSAVELGDDLCILGVRQLRRLWRTRQYLFHLLSQDSRGQCESES